MCPTSDKQDRTQKCVKQCFACVKLVSHSGHGHTSPDVASRRREPTHDIKHHQPKIVPRDGWDHLLFLMCCSSRLCFCLCEDCVYIPQICSHPRFHSIENHTSGAAQSSTCVVSFGFCSDTKTKHTHTYLVCCCALTGKSSRY